MKVMLYMLLFIFFILSTTSIIKIDITHSKYSECLYSPVKIGTPHFAKDFGFDLHSDYSLINAMNFYISQFSLSYKHSNQTVRNKKDNNIKYNLSFDQITVGNLGYDSVIKEFPFLVIMKKELIPRNMRGLAGIISLSSCNNSLLSVLYNRGIIDYKSFLITHKTLMIGKEPNNELLYFCNMLNDEFDCFLNTIEFILNKKVSFRLSIKETIKFELSSKKILLPLHYLVYFEHYYFGQLLQNNSCNKTYYEEDIIYRCNIINNKSVSFVFEHFKMHLPDILLFTEKDNIYESLFVFGNYTNIYIGYDVIEYYEMYFNGNAKYIQFTSHTNLLQLVNRYVVKIIGTNSLLLCLGIFFIFTNKMFNFIY